MRIIQEISPEEMIAEFLRYEYFSPRFGPRIRKELKKKNAASALITKPNTGSKRENKSRKDILGRARGYPNSKLFKGMPREVKYYEVALTFNELGKLRFINHPHWQNKNDKLREVRNTAKVFSRTKRHHANQDIKKVRLLLKKGKDMGPLLLIARSLKARKFVILEGNVRAAALYLRRKQGPYRSIVAISSRIGQMKYF